jgi:hypothetical protein
VTWAVGLGVFALGGLSLLIGFILLVVEAKSQGSIETQWGNFKGPVWFIFMIFGIVMMIVGWMMPF